jgi:multisubunit Na+/H+ antiporter MnhC subunit
MKEFAEFVDLLNKLSLPAALVLVAIVLGVAWWLR